MLIITGSIETSASCCGPAAAGCGGRARGPRKMQQRLVLDAVSRGKIPWRKETPLGEEETPLGETLTPLFLQGLVLGPHKSRGGKFAHT